ncbi:putative nucleotidyltransferase substrate binding domain-containing protein [Sulfurovum sp. ST-21]|uniref:Cyclic nucleotide-binding/CBS domain-containing protein n=1 Tax=Sulfurovum indicum TaxID=2779528 RepID=A0A7M1S6Z0_9BACT|nr:putative nucleotidyltransferase substrate binding domain-containing protein [Sulfurovum indicum]QOR62882.1 cyclic nucleotide-binding/CBS domain-containing protein [Sulfurovum indicum]
MIALLQRLKEHLPFSLLGKEEQKTIEKSAQIVYYPQETILIATDQTPDRLYYIIKGVVEAIVNDELVDIYHQDDTFGGIELIEKQPSGYDYIVTEEMICYEIPKEVFLQLCDSNEAFRSYFFSSIVERIDMIKERRESAKTADLMVARIDRDILHPACIVEPDISVTEAVAELETEGAAALLVNNTEGYGIVTDMDLRKYILSKEREELLTVSQIQTFPAITVSEGELLFNVLILMTGHSIKHMPVVDENEKPVGILTLIDLLSYFSNQSHLITTQIENAGDIESVIDASKRIDVMVKTLHLKGIKSRYIAKMVSEVHKKMYARLFMLIFPRSWHEKCTLLLLGSEGRGEQILKTDQDNALIFEDGFEAEGKEEILPKFTEALEAIGFPRCKGNVMVINPRWAKEVNSYKADIEEWINHTESNGLIELSIFYDAFAVAGNKALFIGLRDHLIAEAKKHQSFLPHFAKPIESFESPLGLFSRFVSRERDHKDEIDIKKGALFAIVHGIRALALEHGITKTNTTQRIKALNNAGYMTKEDAVNLMETLEVLMTFRLHARLQKLEEGKSPDNYIDLKRLSKLEKDTLKEALKIVEQFKKRVAYHFHLSMVG